MNGLKSHISIAREIAALSAKSTARVVLLPPATLLPILAQALEGTRVELGGQDCHHADSGPYTGDISATMLREAGAKLVMLGHSERRHGHLEPSALVAQKVRAALRAGLEPLVCIGETLEQRAGGLTRQILTKQLNDSLPDELRGQTFHLSYEPVWAIGTGRIATDEQIIEAFALIREFLDRRFSGEAVPHLLYGGSVKPSNAEQILRLEGVSGALVGGASLTAGDFGQIITAADAAHS